MTTSDKDGESDVRRLNESETQEKSVTLEKMGHAGPGLLEKGEAGIGRESKDKKDKTRTYY